MAHRSERINLGRTREKTNEHHDYAGHKLGDKTSTATGMGVRRKNSLEIITIIQDMCQVILTITVIATRAAIPGSEAASFLEELFD